jgi:UPF0755 protein
MIKKFTILGYLVFVVVILVFYFYWQSLPLKKNGSLQKVVIYQGEGIKEIGQKLEDLGLIRDKNIFQLFVYLRGLRSKFWPGEYSLSPAMGLMEIIQKLVRHAPTKEVVVTFPEGWTSKQMADRLEVLGLVKREDFLALVNSPSNFVAEFDFLNETRITSLEGYLFPDTYRFYLETTAGEVIKKMLNNFSLKFTPEMREEALRQKKSIFEILIVASLVEKEANSEEDRRMIADIFWRRLAIGQPLQSCATINYILGTSKRRLSFEETRTPSPYNTYLHPGLPPGPINNPGLSSIKATLWPQKNDYWYFLATEDGKTIFSRTKEEHDAAKQKYLK